ncbi:MAG TPA: penicillin-binding protein 2 [Dissulfurispiraceae bacterium]|nr:penicillin-binding protein 2 [Dissulfurispiraceae bacterium]
MTTLYRRIQIGSYVILVFVLVLGLRLLQLQVIEADKYKRLSEQNRLRILRVPAARGIIFDRNGVALVKNIPYFSVSIMPESRQTVDTAALAELLGMSRGDVEERLNRKNLSPFVPIKLRLGLTPREVARIEARRADFPGLSIDTDMGREYIFGKAGSQVVGYLGKITNAQLMNPHLRNFPPDTMIGQWGIEAMYDEQLRGTAGEKIIEIDALGRELRLIHEQKPMRGKDITLSIDIEVHRAMEGAFGEKAGAVVALDPRSGEVLALESIPTFDPNVFARGITAAEWKALVENKKNPMLNRALQSQYPPGSTFKIITAVAALERGVITPDMRVYCKGGISSGPWTFGCWQKGGHGSVNLHRAIVESCDVYFYEVGRRLGIDAISQYALAFGLGKETGLAIHPVKERRGLIPTAEWKKDNKGLPWYLGDTFMSAIGQGFITTTPLQTALMMSTFANGGTLIAPTLIKGESGRRETLGLRPDTLALVKKGLAGVVNEGNGTAKGARSAMTVIGGKTGTAQVIGKRKGAVAERFMDHAWFVAFAPVEEPEIAVAIFVEHGGSGGKAAAPLARRAIDAYMMSKKKDEKAAVQ